VPGYDTCITNLVFVLQVSNHYTMALEKYKEKRSFDNTPEPVGGKGAGSKLIFVIQKHAASHLHYDFRLEMGGVLKSWAVPKGPSMDPAIKHLAMMVEDHPYDYKDFEGIIPKGNYGAGTVIIWDYGTYEPLEKTTSKKQAEKLLLKQLFAGSLKFSMQGKKLEGEFALVKTHGRGENSWLLIKHRDKYATEADITKKDKSVVSGTTLEKMAGDPKAAQWKSNRSSSGKKTVSSKKISAKDEKKTTASAKKSSIKKPSGTASKKKPLLNSTDETKEVQVDGHALIFKHLSKIYWPKEGFTKRQLLNYYYEASPFILPYLKDRPQSLNRFPNGIGGESFYHKDVTATAPEWVKQFPYKTNGENKNFLVVEDTASILWMANLGAIEMNPWNSRIQTPDHPDWCIIDLDPTDKNTFDEVIKTALVTKEVLDDFNVMAYPKTSGSTGMHIYIPLGAKYTYDESQMFAQIIATEVRDRLSSLTSIERMTNKRKGKIYVDFLQNRPKATLAAPYSVRPKPGATVSMPLEWDEIKKGLKMNQFTMENALAQVRERSDLFKPVLGKGINMEKILHAIQ
jgi:DNA ligase D-like protein (predicted polymerase)/DNA ligase D-like protein (predicted 3'-phosphoesterase)